MKRHTFLWIMTGILICMLCGCKTEAVKNVEEKIALIEASEDSGKTIREARAAYNSLTEKEQSTVSNFDYLMEAEKKYDQTFADEVVEKITQIGEINEESRLAIESARKAYDSLTKSQKQLVTNFDSLISAEKEYNSYMVTFSEELLRRIEETVTGSEEIEKASSVYSDLSDAQRREVKNSLPNPEQIIENAYVRWTIQLISAIDYEGGMPSKEELQSMIDAKMAYDELNTAQKENVTNGKLLEKSLKSFKKFCDSREKTDSVYAKYEYVLQCQDADYTALVDYPKTSKGKQVALKVRIESVEKSIFSNSIQALFEENSEQPVFLVDGRKIKEPPLRIGDSLTVYGIADGLRTVNVTEDNSGWFGTNFMNKKTGEYDVPVIRINYTDQESPYELENPLDFQKEEMIEQLLQMIEE